MGADGILGGGIPLQPSIKQKNFSLMQKHMPKLMHFLLLLILIHVKFNTH